MIACMGFEADILMAALATIVMTGLISNRRLFLVVLVVSCSVIANLPADILKSYGLDPDIIFGLLIALVIIPVGAKVSGRFYYV